MSETKQKPARYISRYLKMKIVMKPTYNQVAEGRVIPVPGKKIVFDGGVFETTDKEEQAFIEARPEFGQIIIKAPEDVEAMATRDEWMKDLETKEAELKAREEALEAERVRLGMDEAGKNPEEDGEEDELDKLGRQELLELLKAEKEADPEHYKDLNGNSKNEDIVAAIKAKREDEPEFTS